MEFFLPPVRDGTTPFGTACERRKVGIRKRNDTLYMLRRHGVDDAVFVIDRLPCLVTATDEVSAVGAVLQVSEWPKRRDWHVSFDDTRQADTAEGGRRVWVVLVANVESLTTPMAKETPNPIFTGVSRRKEAEPDPSGPVLIVSLISRLETLRDVGLDQVVLHQSLDAARKHFSVGQLHAVASDLIRLGIREARAMPAHNLIWLQGIPQTAHGLIEHLRRDPTPFGLPA